MTRVAIYALILVFFVGCGARGPRRLGKSAEPYVINTTLVDPARNAATFSISIDSQSSQSNAKEVAEMVIDKFKSQYPNITVKTYLMGSDLGGLPFATSMFADNVTTHLVNQQVAPQKIPTH